MTFFLDAAFPHIYHILNCGKVLFRIMIARLISCKFSSDFISLSTNVDVNCVMQHSCIKVVKMANVK